MISKVTHSRPALMVLAAVGLASAGTAVWLTLSPPRFDGGDPQPTPTDVAQQQETQVFWLVNEGDALVLAPTTVMLEANPNQPERLIKARLERLFAGPVNGDVATSIPENTRLNRLEVKADGIHIDVSRDFTQGGGSASMQGRLGQVIFTATASDTDAPVWISVAGEPLRVLGGEGLEVTQPITRKQFQAAFPLRSQ